MRAVPVIPPPIPGDAVSTPPVGGRLGVRITEHEDLVLVSLSGQLDIYTVPDFRRELDSHSHEGAQIVIDLAEVTLIDSSGLGALLSLRNRAQRDGAGQLGLVCPRRRLRRVFEITGLRTAFTLEADLAAVRVALRGAG